MLHHISRRQKIIVMLAVMSALFLFALDQLIIATALGRIVQDFNSFSSLSYIVTAYLLTSTLAVPIAGKLSDLFGRRLVLLVGIGIFTVASFFSGAAGDINQLILWRAVQGIGGGIITANAFAVIGDLFAPRERGRWQGVFGGVFGIASVIGPLLGGFLTEGHQIFGLTTSWRWTLWVNVPIGIVVFILIAIFMPQIKHEKKPRIDFAGAALLSVGLASLILAVDNTDKVFGGFIDASGWSTTAVKVALFSLAAISTIGLVWLERRVREPIFNLGFFKNRNFSIFMFMSILTGAAFLGAILYITQFNQQVFGVSPSTAGLMIIPMVLGLVTSSVIGGQIMQRTGHYKKVMIFGGLVAGAGIFSLSFLTPTSSFLFEAVLMVITGVGLGTLLPTLNLAVQNEFNQKELGQVTALTQLFRNLGSTVGTAVFGGMLTAGIIASLGNVQKIPYVQSLADQPSSAAAKQFDFNNIDSDTALTLNTKDAKEKITNGIKSGLAGAQAKVEKDANQKIETSPVPTAAKTKLKKETKTQIDNKFQQSKKSIFKKQANFSHDVKYAFSDSLRAVFYVAAGLMLAVFIAALFIKEKILRHGSEDETPGVV